MTKLTIETDYSLDSEGRIVASVEKDAPTASDCLELFVYAMRGIGFSDDVIAAALAEPNWEVLGLPSPKGIPLYELRQE